MSSSEYSDVPSEEEEELETPVGSSNSSSRTLNNQEDLDKKMPLKSLPLFSKFKDTSSRPLQISADGTPIITSFTAVMDSPDLTPRISRNPEFSRPCSSRQTCSDKSGDTLDEDPAIVAAVETLIEEFGKGSLVNQEILGAIEILSFSPMGKGMLRPELALKALETRAMGGKTQVAHCLSNMARLGIAQLFGCLVGMETMLNIMQSINAGALLGGLSELIDNLAEREKTAQAQQRASLASLTEVTTVFNKSTETLQKCTSSAETLLFTIQDVQAKIIHVPASTPRSISSAVSRSREKPVEKLDRPGTFTCTYGTLTLTDKGTSFDGTGKEARMLSELSSLSTKVSVYQFLLNKSLEGLLSWLDRRPDFVRVVKAGTKADKLNLFNEIIEEVDEGYYQWSEVQ